MPIIKSAKKKLKQDLVRKARNLKYEETYKRFMKEVFKVAKTTPKKLGEIKKKAFSSIDKARKKGIIHSNKAARLKSQVSKTVSTK